MLVTDVLNLLRFLIYFFFFCCHFRLLVRIHMVSSYSNFYLLFSRFFVIFVSLPLTFFVLSVLF